MKTLNLIRVQSHLFIPIALMISEYYREKGEDSVISVPKFISDELKVLSMKYGRDYVSEGDLFEAIDFTQYQEVNIVFHHYGEALTPCQSLSSEFVAKDVSVIVSYYADGFVNVFLDLDYVHDLVTNKLNLKERHAISFDKTMTHFKKKMLDITHIEVPSSLLQIIFEKYGFSSIFASIINKSSINPHKKFLVLVMRPWGSETFHGGNYSLIEGGKSLAEIVEHILSKICLNESGNVHLLYRSDSRDLKVKEEFERCFFNKKNYIPYTFIDDYIPSWLTLDFFLIYFVKNISKDLTLITFDSSTSLSLMPLAIGVKHVFGAPLTITEKLKKNADMTNIFLNKVNISKNHIEQSVSSEIYELSEQSEDGLVIYDLKH